MKNPSTTGGIFFASISYLPITIIMRNFILLFLFSIGCLAQNKERDNFYEEDDSVNLFAFVGKKISVTQFDPNAERPEKIVIDSVTREKTVWKTYSMDAGFRCKYVVLRNVFNKLQKDTVDFIAYDHYGRPGFEDCETVLLYISKSKDGTHFFHQKYQYDELFKKDGMLFGYFKFTIPEDFEVNSRLKHFKIDLKDTITYTLDGYSSYYRETHFPKPFYKIKKDKAIPVRGAGIEDLFLSKKRTRFEELFIKPKE